jgi:N-methylhydantoinase A
MQSNGGMARSNIASNIPATIVESGPAAGVIASSWLGEQIGVRDIISFDMGGTTAKAGTVRGKIPEVVPEYEVAGKIHMGRLVKGSGYPVRFPFIDLAECSAGGGTIASTLNGVIQVGPLSAGADPGPACYGKGGVKATIPDANLILGRLNPRGLLGGEMKMYPKLAEEAFHSLAEEIGVDLEEAAKSVIKIANSIMSKILRIVSIERGYDPRLFSLVAFGGAGPIHACALAEELEIKEILIPPNPGMFSALGLLTADLFHDYTKPLIKRIKDVEPNYLDIVFLEMEDAGYEVLTNEGISDDRQSSHRSLDLRYEGQGYELNVNIGKPIAKETISKSIKEFHTKHREVYGYSSEDEPVEVVNAKLRAIGVLDKPELTERAKYSINRQHERRKVFYETLNDWLETDVYPRTQVDDENNGPAILEQYDSTTVVYPGWSYMQDKLGNLILRRKKG